MDKKELRELKTYLFPTVHDIFFSFLAFLLYFIAFLVTPNMHIMLFPLLVFLFLLMSWKELERIYRLHRSLKHLCSQSKTELLIRDFQQGVPLFNDSIRVGETYLIGKKAAVPFLFDEIQQIYEHRIPLIGIHPFYHDRYIYATTPNGPQMLCMYPYKLPASEISQLYHLIKAKNPSVQWGVMKKKSFESNKYFEPFE